MVEGISRKEMTFKMVRMKHKIPGGAGQ